MSLMRRTKLTRRCELNVLIGIVQGWSDQSGHGTVHHHKVLGAICLCSCHCVDERTRVGNHGSPGLNDDCKAFSRHGAPHCIDEILGGGQLITPVMPNPHVAEVLSMCMKQVLACRCAGGDAETFWVSSRQAEACQTLLQSYFKLSCKMQRELYFSCKAVKPKHRRLMHTTTTLVDLLSLTF